MVKVRWGILGTGLIAGWFADDLPRSESSVLGAVASRDRSRADGFAGARGARAHGRYEDLLADPEIDAVHVALPNHLHAPWAIAAARAGKHVLCEKPVALDAAQARSVFDAADTAGVLLIEGFMFRMHPQATALRRLIEEGRIGDVAILEASFGGRVGDVGNIRLREEFGGGALMDLGAYGVSLARMIAGVAHGRRFADPILVKALGRVSERSRVDEWTTATLQFDHDMIASITCANQVDLPSVVRLWGSEGRIELTNPWQPDFRGRPGGITVERTGGVIEKIPVHSDRPLFAVEADTFVSLMRGAAVDAPVVLPDDSLGGMRVLDQWRAQLGIRFDSEQR